eukprot:3461003-Rhodomonas_salina.1
MGLAHTRTFVLKPVLRGGGCCYQVVVFTVSGARVLSAYALCGTAIAYAAGYALSGSEIAYALTAIACHAVLR